MDSGPASGASATLHAGLWTPDVRQSFLLVVVLGFGVNTLLLTSPIYMLQLYDRVLTSRSEETLFALSFIALFLLIGYGLLEVYRSRLMVDISLSVETSLRDRVFFSLFREALVSREGVNGQPFRDMDTIRSIVSGPGIVALLDLPWSPLFIALIFAMHPLLGAIAVVGALLTLTVAVISERISRGLITEGSTHQLEAARFVDSCLGNADAIHAMGMAGTIRRRWLASYEQSVDIGATAADRVSAFSGSTKALRIVLQSTMLGFGAWLALQDAVSPGVMVAASIIFGRALAPLEQAIGASRGLLAARNAFQRLEALLRRRGGGAELMPLPAPKGVLQVQNLLLVPPGTDKPLLQNISFSLEPGEVLGIVGPSAVGKSSLARVLLGIWQPTRGSVRLDGASLSQWDPIRLGKHIGYLPQDVELIPGTVKDNIARFSDAESDAVVAAAVKAGCHEMVLGLAQGYETFIGTSGARLSGGQSQRVALARCLYGAPCLVVLDEPDANLDVEGVAALDEALSKLRASATTAILITHNPRLLRRADKALLLQDGTTGFLGKPDELVKRLAGGTAAGPNVRRMSK